MDVEKPGGEQGARVELGLVHHQAGDPAGVAVGMHQRLGHDCLS
jgi:hypothetical protein